MAGSKNNKKRNLSKQSPDPESNATGGPPDKYSALELSPPWFTTPLPVQTILDPVSNSPYRTPHTPGRAPTYTELTSGDQQICSGVGTLSQSQSQDLNFNLHLVLKNISDIQRQIAQIVTKLDKLDGIEKKFEELEKSINYLSSEYDDFKKEIKEQNSAIDKCREDLDHDLYKIKELENRVIMAESRSMRDNLIFSNIPEEGINEDPEKKVRELISKTLLIKDDVPFERAHRMGRFTQDRTRPIVVKFSRFKDKMNVLRNAFKLKGSKVGINEQFPAEINERRKLLLPILKQEKSKGNPARLVIDAVITLSAKFVVRGGKVVTDPSFIPRQWHKPQTRIINPSAPSIRASTTRQPVTWQRTQQTQQQTQQSAASHVPPWSHLTSTDKGPQQTSNADASHQGALATRASPMDIPDHEGTAMAPTQRDPSPRRLDIPGHSQESRTLTQ